MNKYSIVGPPGAGKSTQATLLAKAHGLVRISVGDLFRWNITNHTKLGARIQRFTEAGLLVPDEIVSEVMRNRLEQHNWNYGFVLDGYPASRSQAEFYLESYDLNGVILLHVPDALLAERLSHLRVCSECGFDPNLIYDQARAGEICLLCGGPLALRHSESPAAIAERLREYHNKTEPMIDLLRLRELVVILDGTQAAEEVHHRIQAEFGLTSEALAQLLKGKT